MLPLGDSVSLCPSVPLLPVSAAIALALVHVPDTFQLVVASQAPRNASYPHGSQKLGSALQIAVNSRF